MEELRAALAALAAGGGPAGGVAAALDRVEALGRELAPELPAELRHFLDRRSYVKALAYLDGLAGA